MAAIIDADIPSSMSLPFSEDILLLSSTLLLVQVILASVFFLLPDELNDRFEDWGSYIWCVGGKAEDFILAID